MSSMEFRRRLIPEEGHRNEPVWDARGKRVGARCGALAGGGGGGEYGECGDDAHGRRRSVPAADAGVSRRAHAALSGDAGEIAQGVSGWRSAGGARGGGYVSHAEPV